MLIKLIVVLIFVLEVVWCNQESVKRCARSFNTCRLSPQGTEGPYYWNATVRRDITEGKPGIPLQLAVTVLDVNTCLPIPNVIVDIWQCDAVGIYSHFIASSLGQINAKYDNTTFLRGQQITDLNGVVFFNTIYPGWYYGRAVHIHVKVYIGSILTRYNGAIYAKGGHVSHTGQFYFDDNLTDKIATIYPYSTRNIRRIRNHEDEIYLNENGSSMILPIQFLTNELIGPMKTEVTLAIDPTATSTYLRK